MPKKTRKRKKKDDKWGFGGSWKPPGADWPGPGGIPKKKSTKKKQQKKKRRRKK